MAKTVPPIDLDDVIALLDVLRQNRQEVATDLLNTALRASGRPEVSSVSPGVLPTGYDPSEGSPEQIAVARWKTAINAAS